MPSRRTHNEAISCRAQSKLLQFDGRRLRDLATAGLQEQCDGEVVALDGLNRRLREQRELHGPCGIRRWTPPFRAAARRFDEPVLCERAEHAVDHRGQLALAPAQEEL